jgi:hypothetical protein
MVAYIGSPCIKDSYLNLRPFKLSINSSINKKFWRALNRLLSSHDLTIMYQLHCNYSNLHILASIITQPTTLHKYDFNCHTTITLLWRLPNVTFNSLRLTGACFVSTSEVWTYAIVLPFLLLLLTLLPPTSVGATATTVRATYYSCHNYCPLTTKKSLQ